MSLAALSLYLGRDQKGYCARLELVPRSFPEKLEAVGRQMNEKWLIHCESRDGGQKSVSVQMVQMMPMQMGT